MAQENLLFFDKDGLKYSYEDTQPQLTSTFKKYQVVNGKWIFYKNVKFNGDQAGGLSSDILIADEPNVTPEDLPFSPKSIRRLEDSLDSSIVFEHSYYGGIGKEYIEACPDVTDVFPATPGSGASSIIVWPNKSWHLYAATSYQGGSAKIDPGRYPTPADMGFPNDKLQSIRPA